MAMLALEQKWVAHTLSRSVYFERRIDLMQLSYTSIHEIISILPSGYIKYVLDAIMAQLVAQGTCNAQVPGSSPGGGWNAIFSTFTWCVLFLLIENIQHWRNLVAHLLWEQTVECSNHSCQTIWPHSLAEQNSGLSIRRPEFDPRWGLHCFLSLPRQSGLNFMPEKKQSSLEESWKPSCKIGTQ